MIWRREEYIAHNLFQYTGKEMFCELFGPLIGLDEEWRSQGASEEEIGLGAFEWDYVLKTQIAAKCGVMNDVQPHTIREDEDYWEGIDEYGRLSRMSKKCATLPLPQSYPVTCGEDWERIRHWYTFREDRIDMEALQNQKKLHDQGYLTFFSIPGGFDEPRNLMGEEALCMAYYDEPEMIEDMLAVMGDTAVKVIERVAQIVPIDCLSVHEDMAGCSGPMIGPQVVHDVMRPYYEKVWGAAKQAGAKLFSQDSDGDIRPLIDEFLASGINVLYPCEPAAGMDIVELRKKYGTRVAFKGGINKYLLREGKDAIRRELEYKMSPTTMGGGTVFALDHRIPNGVPLENYRYYVKLGKELLGIPVTGEKGWERMAF